MTGPERFSTGHGPAPADPSSVFDSLRYRTVEEALRVAGRRAQSESHRAFCKRMRQSETALSPEAIRVLMQIELCGTGRVRSTPGGRYRVERVRCGYPLCPTCGIKSRNREQPRITELILNGKHEFGDDAVSLVTINLQPCVPDEVKERVAKARMGLRRLLTKEGLEVRIEGEFEVVSEADDNHVRGRRTVRGWTDWRRKPGEGVITTPASAQGRKVKPHLHAVAVHPEMKRQRLSRLLAREFGQTVRVEPIKDRVGAGGRWVSGAERVVKYFLDKSAAVKGRNRSGEVSAQVVAFDAYTRLSAGKRLRPRLRIGKLVAPTRPAAKARLITDCGKEPPMSNRARAVLGHPNPTRPSMQYRLRALAHRQKQPQPEVSEQLAEIPGEGRTTGRQESKFAGSA